MPRNIFFYIVCYSINNFNIFNNNEQLLFIIKAKFITILVQTL